MIISGSVLNKVFRQFHCPALQWRHNERDGLSNHRCLECIFNRLFRYSSASLAFVRGIHRWPVDSPHKGPVTRKMLPFDDVIIGRRLIYTSYIMKCRTCCPASRTTLVATRFRVAVICPIIQVPHCIRVFFYFVWFVFINHIFQFYYELCTYCNILDIYLS